MSMPYTRTALSLALIFTALFGTLQDKTTGQPLPNVSVAAGHATATTDAHGRFVLKLAPGSYTLTVESNDVPPQAFAVRAKPGRTNVTLKACSTTLDYHCAGPGGGPG
jgi:hypothetical protein